MSGRRSHTYLIRALLEAQTEQAREALYSAMDGGASVAEICDGPITRALHEVGEQWKHSAEGIFNEHRAAIICIELLVHFRMRLPQGRGSPLALGGTPAGDVYQVASMMAALVFKSEGWADINLGPNVTIEAYRFAIRSYRPAAVWISFNMEEPAARFVEEWKPMLEEAERAGITVFVGGRAFPSGAESAGNCLRHLPDMTSLARAIRGYSNRGTADDDAIVV